MISGGIVAKKVRTTQIRLVSSEGTGFFYVTKKTQATEGKLKLKKYDNNLRKHVVFQEAKIK
jgi:large subunit ribosomal protein L33